MEGSWISTTKINSNCADMNLEKYIPLRSRIASGDNLNKPNLSSKSSISLTPKGDKINE